MAYINNLSGGGSSGNNPAPAGVSSFNSRNGAVVPVLGDYTASLITNSTIAPIITHRNLQSSMQDICNAIITTQSQISHLNARNIAFTPADNLISTNVDACLKEIYDKVQNSVVKSGILNIYQCNNDLGGNLNKLLEEAQKMQDKMKAAQEELTLLSVEGKAGGGMVKVTMNGRHDVSKVTIAPSLLDEEVEILQDLIAAAVNDAVRQVEKVSKEKINQLTAGLNIPTDFMKESE